MHTTPICYFFSISVTLIPQSGICFGSIGPPVLRCGEVPVKPRPVASHPLTVHHDLATLKS